MERILHGFEHFDRSWSSYFNINNICKFQKLQYSSSAIFFLFFSFSVSSFSCFLFFLLFLFFLAFRLDECEEIHKEYLKSGKLFATGFVLRHAPLYLSLFIYFLVILFYFNIIVIILKIYETIIQCDYKHCILLTISTSFSLIKCVTTELYLFKFYVSIGVSLKMQLVEI